METKPYLNILFLCLISLDAMTKTFINQNWTLVNTAAACHEIEKEDNYKVDHLLTLLLQAMKVRWKIKLHGGQR